MKARYYVGYVGYREGFRAFRCEYQPTPDTHGDRNESGQGPFCYVVGPFATRAGAMWAQRYGGRGNPHFTGVDAAERFARLERAR